MSEVEQRIEGLEAAVAGISQQIDEIKLQMVAAKGEADAAAPVLEQRLRKIESVVGLLELG